MAESTAELNKLIKLQRQRPSYSRMISWELGQAAFQEPAKKTRRKKKRDFSGESRGEGELYEDDVKEEGSTVTISDDSSEYETAEEDIDDVVDKLTETSLTCSSSESLDDLEEPDFLTCSTSGSLAGSSVTRGSNNATDGGRRRRLSKKQKRKRKFLFKTTHLDELYNLGNCFDVTDDIENVFSDVTESGTDVNVQRRVLSLVELCLFAARWKPRSNSERNKSKQLPVMSEIPPMIKRQLITFGKDQREHQTQLSYLQNHVLPLLVDIELLLEGSRLFESENKLKTKSLRRSVFNCIASPNCNNCLAFTTCEKYSSFLLSPTANIYTEAMNNWCWNCQNDIHEHATALASVISALGTTIDLMLPSQLLLASSSGDWKSDNRFRTVIYRVKRALSLRYKMLIEKLFDVTLPYVMWARGHVAIATDLFKSLVDSMTDCGNKAMLLSEIAKMHAQFRDSNTAVKFYRLASETALDGVPTINDKAINEITEQQQILLAGVHDTGLLDKDKAVQSGNYWSGARNLPKARTVTAIASIDAFLCYHAAHWDQGSWLDEALRKIEGCVKEHPYLTYYQSMLYAIMGSTDMSLKMYRQCRMMTFSPPGLTLLPMIGKGCKNPWQPLIDTVKGQGSPVQPLKVIWRSQLGHPWHTVQRATEAQISSPAVNLQLNENGHVTGDLQMMMPPIREVTFDPYTGALMLNNVPSYNGTWKSTYFPEENYHIRGMLLPTPALIYSNDRGVTIHWVNTNKKSLDQSIHGTSHHLDKIFRTQSVALLHWNNGNGCSAKLNIFTELKKKKRKEILDLFQVVQGYGRRNWGEEDLIAARQLIELAFKSNIYIDQNAVEYQVNIIKARKKTAEKKVKSESCSKTKKKKAQGKVAWNGNEECNDLYLFAEPFVFGDAIVLFVKFGKFSIPEKYCVFVDTTTRDSFLQCKVLNMNERRFNLMEQGRNNHTDENFFMMYSKQSVHIFNRCGICVHKLGEEFKSDWIKQETVILGPCVYACNKEKNSICQFVIGDNSEDTETQVLEDSIVWSLAPFIVELTARNPEPPKIEKLITVGKEMKFFIVLLDRAMVVMSPHNMECLNITVDDKCQLLFDLNETKNLVMGDFSSYKLFEEKSFIEDDQVITRLACRCQNKLLVMDIMGNEQGQNATVVVKTCINLLSVPKDMCFVGKQTLMVSVSQHDEANVNYREHVLHFDLTGHLHGILLCLGQGPRSFLPVYLPGDKEAGEERQAGWRVYMRDGRGGILCVQLDQ